MECRRYFDQKVEYFGNNILFACERCHYDEQAGEEEKNNRELAQFRPAFPLGTKHRFMVGEIANL
jgi:hypothetical protein